MRYRLMIIARVCGSGSGNGAGVTSQIVEFDTEEEACQAIAIIDKAIKESAYPYLSSLRLY